MIETSIEEVIVKIETIELLLRDLRLELEETQDWRRTQELRRAEREIQVCDKVRIRNPGLLQDKEGEVLKVNHETGFVSVLGKKKRRTISRKKKNLEKIKTYSEEEVTGNRYFQK